MNPMLGSGVSTCEYNIIYKSEYENPNAYILSRHPLPEMISDELFYSWKVCSHHQ